MRFLSYSLQDHRYINRVLLSTVRTERQTLPRVVLQGEVNEWLDKGFAVHENPGRGEFIARRRTEEPSPPRLADVAAGDQIEIDGEEYGFSLHVPFGNPTVDRSAFHLSPTALRSYALWYLDSDEVQEAEITLSTCGAVALWQDGAPIVDFAPLSRNRVASWTGSIRLPRGTSFFYLRHDDLAERDTDYYFRVALRSSSAEPRLLLPVPEAFDEDGVQGSENVLAGLRFGKECYRGEPLIAEWDPFPSPLSGGAMVPEGTETGVMLRWAAEKIPFVPGEDRTRLIAGVFSVPPSGGIPAPGTNAEDRNRAELVGSEALPTGYHRLVFTADFMGVGLRRILRVQVRNEADERRRSQRLAVGSAAEDAREASPLAERKRSALRYLATEAESSVFVALARLAVSEGPAEPLVEANLERSLEAARERYDCADFQLIAVLEAFILFGARLSRDLQKNIEETILGFRYWMDEPGNDAMWFFSENHALLFHVCEFAAGSLLPEPRFPNSGLTGREHQEKARRLLNRWFDRFFAESVTEWNSAAYLPVDVHGLTALLLLTDEADLRGMARNALDLIFRDLALYGFHGITAGTQGRSYEKELRGVYGTGTTSLLQIAFGSGALNGEGLAYLGFCLGDYRPGADSERLLQKGDPEHGSGGLIFRRTQGYKRHVTCYLHKTPHALLSTAIAFRPGRPGYQEHVVEAAVGATARCFINHPGEATGGGSGRPSFWAGNGILPKASQYRDIALILFGGAPGGTQNVLVDFTHAYCPLSEFDEVSLLSRHAALRSGDGFIGIVAAAGLRPVVTGDTAGKEFRSHGLVNAWILVVGDRAAYGDFGSFSTFVDALDQSLVFDAHEPERAVTVTHPAYGKIELSMAGPMRVDGIIQEYQTETIKGELETW